ncbi:hypothetical protein C9374_013835 [Naegleria lovaniensis]|uniref:Uncharacterized protein n=1 Tax=Naegleria lovaniensis TaxID=51637 RepID=A0AA88KMS7_NAELO|nr:uncharacterized protein C9374_013835 [Naegleria lovaniensis]KAG2389275.1 hypothetical protein C9374_013835 [Naegleria lovaniensis]
MLMPRVKKHSSLVFVALATLLVLLHQHVLTTTTPKPFKVHTADDGAIHITIIVGAIQKEQQLPPLDATSNKLVQQFKQVISNQKEQDLAKHYLDFAQSLKFIHDGIPNSFSPEAIAMKYELMVLIKDFTLKAQHPGADMLISILKDFSHVKQQAPQQQQQESGVSSLWINAISTTMNLLDGIGTYSDKVSKASQFIGGPVAAKLEKWKLHKLSQMAKTTGTKVDQFTTQNIKPYEDKIAKKIAPVVKSKTFQEYQIAYLLQGIETSLTKASKLVQNRKQVMKLITTRPQRALKTFTKMNLYNKAVTVYGFKSDFSTLKTGIFGEKKQPQPNAGKRPTEPARRVQSPSPNRQPRAVSNRRTPRQQRNQQPRNVRQLRGRP